MNKTLATLGIAGALATGGTVAVDQVMVDPYTDKGTYYEMTLTSDIPQGERVEIAKDKAQMTLKGWNDEYAITITPTNPTDGKDFTVVADRPLLTKRMEYTSGDVTAFIEPKAGTENEFDIDFTLDAKPLTNVFEYKIEGAEDFDFFFQPALTAKEIAEGASRPENVEGSYAVYHKTKANHRVGSTNYGTGKAFHIFRPKAIDALGNEEWAVLNYLNGVLSVTVSQKFLDDAVYPVRVDPTFGYTRQGNTTSQWTNDRFWFIEVVAATNATLDSMSVYSFVFTGTDFNFKCGVFTASDGVFVSNGLTDSVFGNATAVYTAPFSTGPNITLNTKYWLGCVPDSISAGIYYDDTSVDTSRAGFDTNSYTTPVDIGAPTAVLSQITSLYATYTCTSNCVDAFSLAGYYTWTVPTGVTSVDIACWGGGGGGRDDNSAVAEGGGGGGGAAFASSTKVVSPSDVIRLFVGAGGAENTQGATSTASTTAPTLLVAASPGYSSAVDLTGGLGGANSTGDVTKNGGNGGLGTNTGDTSGGGGGAGSPSGNGGNGVAGNGTVGGNGGTTNNGATAGGQNVSTSDGLPGNDTSTGGSGGAGGDDNAGGGSGGWPGGGGGGGEVCDTQTQCIGGTGQCTITYTIASGGASPSSGSGVIWFDD